MNDPRDCICPGATFVTGVDAVLMAVPNVEYVLCPLHGECDEVYKTDEQRSFEARARNAESAAIAAANASNAAAVDPGPPSPEIVDAASKV